MNIDPAIAARIKSAFTHEAYASLHEHCEQRIKKALQELVNATDEPMTWRLRGEINTLRLFSDLRESAEKSLSAANSG